MTVSAREWQLAARPHGEPTPDDFRLVDVEHPDPAEGQVVVSMIAMSSGASSAKRPRWG